VDFDEAEVLLDVPVVNLAFFVTLTLTGSPLSSVGTFLFRFPSSFVVVEGMSKFFLVDFADILMKFLGTDHCIMLVL
jgi:hypothetical protein